MVNQGEAAINLRDAIAGTHHASLAWSPDRERAVDRVAALGRCDTFGVLLWKARYMLESWAYREALWQLVKRFRSRYKAESPEMAMTLCTQALTEFIASFCPTCTGSGEVMNGERKETCLDCAGTGVRRYSNPERSRMMRMSLQRYALVEHKLTWVYRLIAEEEGRVNTILNVELERFSELP